MASNASARSAHLDATAGRTVVFCHACQHEWYEDEEGQEICPSCHGEIIELVSPESDPRELYSDDHMAASLPDLHPRHQADDSDPDEADIDDHMHHGPGGFRFFQRSWPADPHADHPEPGSPQPDDPQRPQGGQGGPPDDGEDIIRRFIDMITGFGMNRMAPGAPFPGQGAPGQQAPGQQVPGQQAPGQQAQGQQAQGQNMPGQHMPGQSPLGPFFLGGGSSVRRTTFTSGDGRHTTSVTITSGPLHFGGTQRMGREDMAFPNAFRTLLGGMGPPPGGPQDRGQGQGRPGGAGDPQLVVSSLQELLSFIIDPANARHGDAVYSQEALDQIISNLMEANPQSNAAPPASESALAGLERKKMDAAMLEKEGGKAECTVCIDEIKADEEVVFLPCKHWFHDACVVMWLREHNTCPICRTSIEPGGGSGRGNAGSRGANLGQPGAGGAGQQQQQQQQQPQPQPQDPTAFLRGRPFALPAFFDASRGWQEQPDRAAADYPGSGPNPREALRRNASGTGAAAGPSAGGSGGVSTDRDQRWPNVGSRRSSMSPPNTSDAGSRTRTRSPSTNSRRSAPPSDQEGQADAGQRRAFGWFREHLSRGSDRRRRDM